MEILISQFQDRLHFGINSELLELMKLPSLNGVRARTLFDSGFETVSSIASADVNIIENILHKAVPFQSEKEREDDDSYDMKKRNKIKSIWVTGCCGMTVKEAAQNLIIEARKHVEKEIGVTEIKWNTNVSIITKPSEDAINANQEETTKLIKNTSKLKQDEYCENIIEQKVKQETTQPIKDVIKFEVEENCENSLENKVELNEAVDCNPISESEHKTSRMSLDLLDISAEDVYISANSCHIGAIQNQSVYIKEEKDYLDCDMFQKTIRVNTPTVKAEVLTQRHSTPIIESSNTPKVICDASAAIKDEIVWDSLNFTEAALGNITKLRTSAKNFSPNISFGDTDNSSASANVLDENGIKNECKATYVKDISLFSTDGDNSSFFEESLPLDLIPSRLLDNINTSAATAKPETKTDFVSINSNSIIDRFKSPLVESDEDIKLIFEESETDSLPESCSNLSNDNEVVCSQENLKTMNKFISPCNKRRCIDNTMNLNNHSKKKKLDNVAIAHNFKRKQPTTVKSTIHVNHYRLDCVLIQGNQVSNNLRVLEKNHTASIALKLKEQRSCDYAIIGSDILNIPKQKTEDNLLNGMGLYIGNNDCIFLDTTALENKRNKIKSLFEDNLRLNVCSLKTTYFQLKKGLGIQLPLTSTDVYIAEWLIDSDDRTRCYTKLVRAQRHLKNSLDVRS